MYDPKTMKKNNFTVKKGGLLMKYVGTFYLNILYMLPIEFQC